MSSFLKSHGVSSSSSRRQQQLFDSLAFSSELTSNPDTFRLSTLNDGNAHVRAAAPAFGSSGLGTAPLVGYDGELSCVAFDPLQSLLAVGTRSGQVSVYGEPQRIPKCSWQLRPSQAVKHLVLKAGTSCVVVIGKSRLFLDTYELAFDCRRTSTSQMPRTHCTSLTSPTWTSTVSQTD